MFECQICKKECKNNRSLSCHVKVHNITMLEYKIKFNLLPKCKKCEAHLSTNNKYGYCNKCRDRTGINNPMYGKSVYDQWVLKYGTDHAKELNEIKLKKNSEASKKLWEDEEYREKIKIGTTGLKRTEEFKQTQSVNATKQMQDSNQRKLRSDSMKTSWEDSKIVKNNNIMPNRSKAEKEIYEYLGKSYDVNNSTIKYDGGYFFPDVVIGNICIEYYGDYWHANPTKFDASFINEKTSMSAIQIWEKDKIRVQTLEDLGFMVIIVWENDYKKDKLKVLEKLKENINNVKNKNN